MISEISVRTNEDSVSKVCLRSNRYFGKFVLDEKGRLINLISGEDYLQGNKLSVRDLFFWDIEISPTLTKHYVLGYLTAQGEVHRSMILAQSGVSSDVILRKKVEKADAFMTDDVITLVCLMKGREAVEISTYDVDNDLSTDLLHLQLTRLGRDLCIFPMGEMRFVALLDERDILSIYLINQDSQKPVCLIPEVKLIARGKQGFYYLNSSQEIWKWSSRGKEYFGEIEDVVEYLGRPLIWATKYYFSSAKAYFTFDQYIAFREERDCTYLNDI